MQNSKLPVQLLQEQLLAAQAHTEAVRKANIRGTALEVPGTGRKLSTAYEQLRNVAEYAEEHLLLQRAVRRFYKRTINFYTLQHLANIGEELITELTLASYIKNGSFGQYTTNSIDKLVKAHLQTYQHLIKSRVPRDKAAHWVLDILSVETEGILNPHTSLTALANFAYYHYQHNLPPKAFVASKREAAEFEICLFIAIHQTLLKSDLANVRHDMIRMYGQSDADIKAFARFNRMVDALFISALTGRIKRAVTKYGAPMHILKDLIEARPDLPQLLGNKQDFLATYDAQIRLEYRRARKRLNKGLVRSIAFIFITKVAIGIGIEVPIDLFLYGGVALGPLFTNILFPPLYMASLKLGLKPPNVSNANALHFYMEKTLYTNEPAIVTPLRFTPKKPSILSRVIYGILFFVPFAVTVSVLSTLHFNLIQGVIFFVFLSTASFLGFRLSRITRELELVTKRGGFLGASRDFFYLPFIQAGQWLSSKYARANVMAFVLDMAIEMPMKTILRLARQWTSFVNEKRENL